MKSEPGKPRVGDFSPVARKALRYLRDTVGLSLWMITRVEGDDWIVLESDDCFYGVESPALFRWTDSFCSQMVRGQGPRVAPNASIIPAYAGAPIARQMEISSYIGVPLRNPDESLFGTLCAIDPQPQPESIQRHLPLVELMAEMVSSMLAAEIKAVKLGRQADRAKTRSETDFLTGLYNRRGWDRLSALEDLRCARYGHSAYVAVIDIDGLKTVNDSRGHEAGDQLIVRAARTLKSLFGEADVLARVGGDEFLALRVECGAAGIGDFETRIRAALSESGIPASVGASRRSLKGDIAAAVREADLDMLREKERRKEACAAPCLDAAILTC